MTLMDYQELWNYGKYLAEEFGYKIRGSNLATNQECKVDGITGVDHDYVIEWAGSKSVEWEKLLAAVFLLKAYINQYKGIIMQICNDYAKGQKNYPETVQKVLGLLTA